MRKKWCVVRGAWLEDRSTRPNRTYKYGRVDPDSLDAPLARCGMTFKALVIPNGRQRPYLPSSLPVLFTALMVSSCFSSPRRDGGHAEPVIARSGPFLLEAQNSGTTASLRGLSVVDDRVVWASGAQGTVVRTVNAGETWYTHSAADAKYDLRDIHAFDANKAVAMATAGRLFRTTDGGMTWTQVYASADTSAFLDAISFWDSMHGIVMGDPIGGAFLILLTDDGGVTWRELPKDAAPHALPGEAAFAASGTALAVSRSGSAWFGTGGASRARVFRSADRGRTWTSVDTPVAAGNASSGIFSVAFSDSLNGLVAGGDYRQPNASSASMAYTSDGGRSYSLSPQRPAQYVSSIAIQPSPRSMIMGVGIAGIVYTSRGASGWETLDRGDWNSLGMGRDRAWVVGPAGRIARISF